MIISSGGPAGRLLRRLLVTVLAAAALLIGGVVPASAAGPTWQMQPSGKSGPSTRPHHVYDLAPGAVVKDYVRIENLGEQSLTLRLYATDAFSTTSGQFALLPSAEKPTDVGTWVTMSADEVTVKPGNDVIVPFEVVVPDNASPGDHVGAVISSLVTEQTNSKGEKILVESRIGSRIYLRVKGDTAQQLQIDNLSASWTGSFWRPWDGRVTVSYDVTNTGNIRVTSTPQIVVNGPIGLQLARSAGPALPELLPGSTMRVSSDAEASDAIPGPELSPVFAAGFLRVNLALRADTTIVAAGSVGLVAIPWLLLIALAVVIAAVVVWWWRRRNQQDRIEALVAERVAAERAGDSAAERAGDSAAERAGDSAAERAGDSAGDAQAKKESVSGP